MLALTLTMDEWSIYYKAYVSLTDCSSGPRRPSKITGNP